ncbi:MAG: histidinol-phosphate transaminase, partial [Clostridia bacterium]|nr:histidinol-phosphate transaminase [Clostridia bacterium]
MSRLFSEKYKELIPYVPGEQPKDQQYIKLNTNESPFPPSPMAQAAAADAAKHLELYSDPECRALNELAAKYFGIEKDEILFTNGSDEILNFAFMAFCDDKRPAVFPDITYGFYSVFAALNHIPYTEIPLREDFTINVDDYIGCKKNIFIANPNAPTGIALPLSEIERIVKSNPDNLVVVDEAYVDFGAESAISLTKKYDNLLVTGTFSKSRSMAGARLGFGIACKDLIRDLNTVKYSTNPYNINRMTMAAGIGALTDDDYFKKNCEAVKATRKWTTDALRSLGFRVLDSQTNFVFAEHPGKDGGELYQKLKENGILVRHFTSARLKNFNRITIG